MQFPRQSASRNGRRRLIGRSMDAPSAHTAEIVYARAILGAEMSSMQMKIARQAREEEYRIAQDGE